jgi:hypothetical protein
MSDTPNIGFVRHEPIPPSAPPIQQAGMVKWIVKTYSRIGSIRS